MNIFTITQLNAFIKRTLDREYLFKSFYVTGTIVNAKRHSNGHFYFSLKDEESAIDVTMWSSTAMSKGLINEVVNGVLVTIKAGLNFYGKTGRLNLVVQDMQVGSKSPLQIEFEALKRELTALGYFDDSHKKPISEMATCIGIVTSKSGAVLHDILHVAMQRNPLIQFKLFSVPVQGPKAGAVIAKGIERADEDPSVDLIIVGRGGGSMEDLWCFNDRIVVETIYRAHTPVISAVGHETDYTLCDYAADARGATPSHAAEICVFPLRILQERVAEKENYLHNFMQQVVQRKKMELSAIFNRRLGIPTLQFLHKQKTILQALSQSINQSVEFKLREEQHKLAMLSKQLEVINPVRLMVKGYSKLEKNNTPLRSVEDVSLGDNIHVTLVDGTIETTVKEVTHNGRITEEL